MADADTARDRDRELDRIADDLVGVELALDRLDAGTYWTCEATGQELPDEFLAADPVARRLPVAPPNDPPLR
jgi:RNA polymerase-binding transcription factor DksA